MERQIWIKVTHIVPGRWWTRLLAVIAALLLFLLVVFFFTLFLVLASILIAIAMARIWWKVKRVPGAPSRPGLR